MLIVTPSPRPAPGPSHPCQICMPLTAGAASELNNSNFPEFSPCSNSVTLSHHERFSGLRLSIRPDAERPPDLCADLDCLQNINISSYGIGRLTIAAGPGARGSAGAAGATEELLAGAAGAVTHPPHRYLVWSRPCCCGECQG